jgi:cytochrome c oxidase subunit II
MSIHNPTGNWIKAPHGFERIWIGIALLWCLVLSAAMPYWHFKGQQTSAGEAYRVTPAEFDARVAQYVRTNQVDTYNGIPVVQAQPGGDAYIIGKAWQWYPILKLKKDVEYRLHVSSYDYQHGFGLLPMNMNFHVMPGYDHVITLTPRQAGKFPIICNEFCGAGHHLMTGMIIVEE